MVRARVEEVVYQGSQTSYWVRMEEYRIAIVQQHSRFLLDEQPITWDENVWVSWHADDGFMLERYSAVRRTAEVTLPRRKMEKTIEDKSRIRHDLAFWGSTGMSTRSNRKLNEILVTAALAGMACRAVSRADYHRHSHRFQTDGSFRRRSDAGWTLETLRSLGNPNYPAIIWRTYMAEPGNDLHMHCACYARRLLHCNGLNKKWRQIAAAAGGGAVLDQLSYPYFRMENPAAP